MSNLLPSVYVLKQHILFLNEKKLTYWSWVLGYDLFKGNQENIIDSLYLKFDLVKIDLKEVKLARGIPPVNHELFVNNNGDVLAIDSEYVEKRQRLRIIS